MKTEKTLLYVLDIQIIMIKKLAYISVVATLPEYANRGYGSLVVEDFIQKAKKTEMKAVHLYTDKENKAAMNMYEKLGFVDWKVTNENRPEDKHLIKFL